MSDLPNTLWCAGCGAEILYTPYIVNHQNYCCRDCALGFSCKCGQAIEREDDYRDVDHPLESIYPGA